MGQPAERKRMPLWVFLLLMAAVFVIAWFAQFKHSLFAFALLLPLILIAAVAGKRWQAPASVEAPLVKMQWSESSVYYALGVFSFVFGVILCVVAPIAVISWTVAGNYGIAALNLFFSLPLAVGLVAAGRWFMRNRRSPFRPGPQAPD